MPMPISPASIAPRRLGLVLVGFLSLVVATLLYYVWTTLDDLDESALVKILTEPKNAFIKQYQRLFEMENVGLTFTDDALNAVARKAIARKTGARGLRSILEGILLDTMYELPTYDGVEEVVVNAEVVEGRAQPLIIYAERRDKGGAA